MVQSWCGERKIAVLDSPEDHDTRPHMTIFFPAIIIRSSTLRHISNPRASGAWRQDWACALFSLNRIWGSRTPSRVS